MTPTTTPSYVFFFIIAFGGLVPQYPVLAESEVVTEGSPEEGGGVGGNPPLPVSDISALINNNALEVSRLVGLYQNLLNFASGNPCIEKYFSNEVSSVMADGFKEAAESFKEVQRSFALLKLFAWRIQFAKSLDIPELHRDRPCPLPFFMLDGECVYLENKVKRTFKFAKLACNLMGGFLAEPANITEFSKHVEKMTPGRDVEVYIGIEAHGKDEPWRWINNGEQINEDLNVDTSDASDEEHICLSIKKSEYFGLSCMRRRIFACEIAIPTETEA